MSTIPHSIVNSSLLTIIAGSTFTVIARLRRSRGNLIHYRLEIATSLSLLAMTETCFLHVAIVRSCYRRLLRCKSPQDYLLFARDLAMTKKRKSLLAMT